MWQWEHGHIPPRQICLGEGECPSPTTFFCSSGRIIFCFDDCPFSDMAAWEFFKIWVKIHIACKIPQMLANGLRPFAIDLAVDMEKIGFSQYFSQNFWIKVIPVLLCHQAAYHLICIHPGISCLHIDVRYAATVNYLPNGSELWSAILIMFYFVNSHCSSPTILDIKRVVLPSIALIFCWVWCHAFFTTCLSQPNNYLSLSFQ